MLMFRVASISCIMVPTLIGGAGNSLKLWRGDAAYKAGDREKARSLYEQAVEADPEDIIALYNLGKVAYGQQDFGTARSCFAKVTQSSTIRPEQAEQAYFNLGDSLLQLELYPEAIDAYKRVCEYNKHNSHALQRLELAQKLLQERKKEQAQTGDSAQKKQQQDKREANQAPAQGDKRDQQNKGDQQQRESASDKAEHQQKADQKQDSQRSENQQAQQSSQQQSQDNAQNNACNNNHDSTPLSSQSNQDTYTGSIAEKLLSDHEKQLVEAVTHEDNAARAQMIKAYVSKPHSLPQGYDYKNW